MIVVSKAAAVLLCGVLLSISGYSLSERHFFYYNIETQRA